MRPTIASLENLLSASARALVIGLGGGTVVGAPPRKLYETLARGARAARHAIGILPELAFERSLARSRAAR